MRLWDVLKAVGAGVIKTVVPGGGLLVAAVNEFLPTDKKLPASSTGDDIHRVIATLPEAQRAALLDKEFDVDLTQIREEHSTVRTMLDAEIQTPHTTRPWVARWAFVVVAIIHLAVVLLWADAVRAGKQDIIDAVMGGWPFVIAMTGPFTTLLLAYFGVLKREQKNRLDAAGGTTGGLVSLLSGILRK